MKKQYKSSIIKNHKFTQFFFFLWCPLKVPIAANEKGVCLQNTSKSHSYYLKIWHLL